LQYADRVPRAAERRATKPSEARARLLSAASAIFYAEGINSVGVDRIVSAGQVTLATFYRHFPSKQDLVVAYLEGIHDLIAARLEVLAARCSGHELVRAIGREVVDEIGRDGFRGCAFIKAASEFEDPDSETRRVIADHRDWYYRAVRRAYADAGHPQPGNAARHFVMLRDGAMTAGHLGSRTTATRTFNRGVEGLLRSIDVPSLIPGDDEDT
jgi:AcrR family transcriptional regulator